MTSQSEVQGAKPVSEQPGILCTVTSTFSKFTIMPVLRQFAWIADVGSADKLGLFGKRVTPKRECAYCKK